MELKGKKVLVAGLGKSGLAAALLCLEKGAEVTATDLAQKHPAEKELAAKGAVLALGGHKIEDFTTADLVVLSPGVDHRIAEVRAARKAGAEILGELELAARFLIKPSVMITGSNGKSTVTRAVAAMLQKSGRKVFAGANLGTPLSRFILDGQKADWAVLEVSSFQTDTAVSLKPNVAVILNITPDHLDRYRDFEEYARSKFSLIARQDKSDVAIVCTDDPWLKQHLDEAPGRLWTYGAADDRVPGGRLEGRDMVLTLERGKSLRLSTAGMRISGFFNRLNLMASAMAAIACKARAEDVREVINSFTGLPHRLELVGAKGGVEFFDDSKATNVGAVAAAVKALDKKIVLLLGGRDKKGDFTEIIPLLKQYASHVVCFGEAAELIADQLSPGYEARMGGSLEQAFDMAGSLASPGEAVVLSPGCTSFDAYGSYAERGDHFQDMARKVIHEPA